MLNFFRNVDFSASVWTVSDGKVARSTLGELARRHCAITTTPDGIGPVYHTRGNELWAWGRPAAHRVASFDSDAEAENALMLTFLYDLENDLSVEYFNSKDEAEKFINQ